MLLRHLAPLVAATLALCCAGLTLAPSARAWPATVVPAGTPTIDAAVTEDDSRALFLSLDVRGTIEITFGTKLAHPLDADVFIPAREPERGRPVGELPLVRVPGSDVPFAAEADGDVIEDPSTGLRFIRVGSGRIAAGARAAEVSSGAEATRALVVLRGTDASDEFELDQPTTVPRTVARMRLWYDAPSTSVPQDVQKRSAVAVWSIVSGFAIVVAMIALAIWWGTRGRSAARRPKR